MDKEFNKKVREKRVKLLQSYGFKCNYEEDSNVEVHGVKIDFSAIDEVYFLKYAFIKVAEYYFEQGKLELKKQLNNLIKL